MRYSIAALVVIVAAGGTHVSAQSRQRVTLVLGGGSARGIAHVGVLQWLDEHRVPVDLVVGTSMGGLMGGAFATGMTPAEMKALVSEIDWDRMFLGEAPYDVKTIRRKDDARRYPSRLRFGLKGGLRPPGAIEPGQQIDMLLQRITLPYYGLAHFDDLPTPFRCVAVDLRTSNVVVLAEGPLWRAMRATMAIPGLFSPVRVGEQVLVDGGLLANVPTEAARSLVPAAAVIAINVGADAGATARTPAESYLGALMQTMDVMGSAALASSLRAADLAIRPELDDIGSLDWRRSEVIMQRGYEAAERHRTQLLRWSVGAAEYEEWRQRRARTRRSEAPVPAAVEVVGASAGDTRAIQERFAPMLGRPLEAETLARELTAATGSDRFNTATADFVTGASGLTLRVAMEEKGYGPPFLLTAVDIRNAGETQFVIDLRGRLIAYDVAGAQSELRLDLGIGNGVDSQIEVLRPIGGSRWFAGAAAGYRRATTNVFRDDEALAQYGFERMGAGVEIGFEPTQNTEFRAGYVVSRVDGEVQVGDPFLPAVKGAESGLRLRILYDSMDSPTVPSRGVRARAELAGYFATADVVTATDARAAPVRGELAGATVRAVRRHDRVFVVGSGGTTFGGETTYPPYDFTLGGMLRLGAYDSGELRGSNYLLASTGYLLSLGRLPDFIGGGMYLSTWVEVGSAFNDADALDLKGDVTAGLLAETFLGPVFLGGSIGPDGGRALVSLAPLF